METRHLRALTWMLLGLVAGAHEVTVKHSDLKICIEDNRVCVTDLRDCGPPPPTSVQQTLNMSCYYQIQPRSVTCVLSRRPGGRTQPDVSLIFRSKNKVLSCRGLFNPAAVFNVTARIRNYATGAEIRSQPHTVFLYKAIKPPPPSLTVLNATADSLVVSWRSSREGGCLLRHGARDAPPPPSPVPRPLGFDVRRDQAVVYAIGGLLPFTVYRAAVACGTKAGVWSDWSADVTARTLERAPCRPPEVCYRVEASGGALLLRLTWKELDLGEAGGRVLGYRVSLRDGPVRDVTGAEALLKVEEGSYSVAVAAFNSAGSGPAALLSVDTRAPSDLPPVRNLWVSGPSPAGGGGLLVQWETPSDPPVARFVVQWSSETCPSTGRWVAADGFRTSTVIQGLDPDEPYRVSVSPVRRQRCGRPRSLRASLLRGALLEPVDLKVVAATKTSATVEWAWREKFGPVGVNGYAVTLKGNSETRSLSLWPDQWNHTFLNLRPGTEYSLLLLADNVSRSIVPIKTGFDEVLVVATATPMLLLAVTVFILCILSRTVYKSYFFPPISSPRGSTAGQWLMDPNQKKTAERKILDIKDFQVTDVTGETSIILLGPNRPPSVKDDPREDAALLPPGHPDLKLDPEHVSDATEHQLESHCPDHEVDCRGPGGAFAPEEGREADADTVCRFPRNEEEGGRLEAAPRHLPGLVANADVTCAYQVTCIAEYVANSIPPGRSDVETGAAPIDSSYLVCVGDYVANSFFTAQTAAEDTHGSVAC